MVNVRVAKKYGLEVDGENVRNEEFFMEFDELKRRLPKNLSYFSKASIANIGGWVVKKLTDRRKPMVRCEECQKALFQETQTTAEFHDDLLTQAKSRGGSIFPSESVVLICQRTEEFLRSALNRISYMVPSEKNFPALLCSKVLHDLFNPPCTLFPDLGEHIFF